MHLNKVESQLKPELQEHEKLSTFNTPLTVLPPHYKHLLI